MFAKNKNPLSKAAFGASLLVSMFAMSGNAMALALPSVHNCGYGGSLSNLMCYTTNSGADIYIASQHDDFISYSGKILSTLANDFGYTELSDWSSLPSFGSGQIVKLFSFNNSNNSGFPDATGGTGDNQLGSDADLTAKHDGLYQGNWPVNTTVTIGELKAFLGSGITSPVFTFDFNNNASLYVNGYFRVSRNGVAQDTFAFDNIFNSDYDSDSKVYVQSNMTIQWIDPTNPECDVNTHVCTMNVNNDVGSGKPDFFTYATTFDINDWEDSDTVSFFLNMRGLDGGGEELALTNLITPSTTTVPEPNELLLLGLGLLGLGLARMKKGRVA